MELNRETAMRLWNKTFGKEIKVKDFANRTIVKGAYGDRNSEVGWNVDHILPVSHGGKTNDSNLIITHIKTNDEKADKFPCFSANKVKFEIVKVQNHFEIRTVNKKTKEPIALNDVINFFDSADGIRYFKKLKGIQNKPRFVGSVLIRLKNIRDTAIVDFIEKFLDQENISYDLKKNYNQSETLIIAKNYNMPLKEDINTLLDKCILLNTYLSSYFTVVGYVDEYDIQYRVDFYAEKEKMYLEAQKMELFKTGLSGFYPLLTSLNSYRNKLLINSLVVQNSEAGDKVSCSTYDNWVEFDYVYTNLAENLRKEASR